MSCRHVCHLRRFYYVFTHHASLHLQIFDTSYPHATTHLKNLRRHAYKYPIAFPKLQVHHPTSLNIIPTQSSLAPNIWYYSHTPRRPFIGSSRTFGYSPFHFLSTPDTLVHISEDFYCMKLCTGTHSGIYPFPSIRPLCSHLLKFSITFRSVAKHSHHLSPFSELIGTYSSLIYSFLFLFLFLSPFIFLSFSSHFLHVSCFGSLSFYSYLLHFRFRIFSNICTPMYL